MKFAIDFEVLRGVRSDGRAMCATQPRGKPLHVALLLDEAKFKETGYALHHHQTVFLDDKTHDWDWRMASSTITATPWAWTTRRTSS